MSEEKTSLFRSEPMALTQLYIPLEIAPQTIAELGELGLMQFNDLNPKVNEFQRSFVNEIKRLNDLERKLRFLIAQADKAAVTLQPVDPLTPYARTRSQLEIDQLDTQLGELEARIEQMNTSHVSLNKRFLELTELRHVLRETAVFFQIAESRADEIAIGGNTREDAGLLANQQRESLDPGTSGGHTISIGFVAGVIPRSKMGIFERILFRALRGNLFMNHAEIQEAIIDPVTDETVTKNVFIVFAHGKELLNKIKKISESMGATLYPVDEHPDKRRESALEVMARIEDLRHVLDNTKAARRAELSRVAEHLNHWSVIIEKEKAIHHQMNKMSYDVNRKALISEGWCPKASIGAIQYSLRAVTERTGTTIPPLLNELPTTRTPPTSQRVNKITNAFQIIVDAYGVAKYGEVNPGLFTVITFPFLFAVMFGDFGHGILVTIFSIWVVTNEKTLAKKKWGEFWVMIFGGRYIILLMGIFSIFTGLVYNDMFSQSMTLMSSEYTFNFQEDVGKWIGSKTHTYGFGVDPAWQTSDNFLIFANSYKMKMSIILGVIHMSFGMCLQVFNHLHFRKPMYIVLEFVPQILFFMSLFGYLVFLIVFKWLTYYENTSEAPGLLNTLIYMVLSPGSIAMPLYPGQGPVQVFLVFIAFISIPWMLLGKPLYELQEHKRTVGAGYAPTSRGNEQAAILAEQGEQAHEEGQEDDHGGHGGQFDFSDLMMHQMIHTIEFTLSGISNTASYLRLWALSLAHAQLSDVLWEMVLLPALTSENAIAIVIGFYMWFSMTVGILICMEGMSAFLHALRLHWVEFQSKFYGGTGTQFLPFSFQAIFEEQEE
ncbi:H(+)-transporting V0 sector ATPase subunit a [Boothiomyces sp. JEL0866]|nr:H(+)-transporting V0 sector ATPase subunit a [Boothiomyces sp. JEL0866]